MRKINTHTEANVRSETMEVILKQDIVGLGEEGDIKTIAPGYGRNFLIPNKMAVLKTPQNLKILEQEMEAIQKRRQKKRDESKSISERLENMVLTIPVSAGDNEKLFGSVTSKEIARFLHEQNFDIDKRRIELKSPIKMLGNYKVRIKLHEEINPEIAIHVVREEELNSPTSDKTETSTEVTEFATDTESSPAEEALQTSTEKDGEQENPKPEAAETT